MISRRIQKEIRYIGFYDLPQSKNNRVAALAATNKMDYICDALNRAGYVVHLVSPSWFADSASDAGFQPQSTLQLGKQKKLTLCPSVGTKTKLTRNIKVMLSLTWLFFWLVLHTRRNEKVLAYHSPWLSLPIRCAKYAKGFELILEVEEVYGQVWDIKSIMRKWETKVLSCADSYIAVSEILAEILGEKTKIVLYGSYTLPEAPRTIPKHSKINVIYAGSIDHIKGGAFNSIKCVRFLPQEYIIHICGFGEPADISELEREIAQANIELGRTACIYYSTKTGEEFRRIMNNCHIGINPQTEGEHMNSAFPSKVLTYLSYNLRVVSTRIKSVKKSQISSLIHFSENNSPESIAKAILQIDLSSPYDCKKTIENLDKTFVEEIGLLFKSAE